MRHRCLVLLNWLKLLISYYQLNDVYEKHWTIQNAYVEERRCSQLWGKVFYNHWLINNYYHHHAGEKKKVFCFTGLTCIYSGMWWTRWRNQRYVFLWAKISHHGQGHTYPRPWRLNFAHWLLILWILSMEPASCRPSGTTDSDVATRFSKNLRTPAL